MARIRSKTGKTCGECRYFLRHYVLLKDGSYLPTEFGHCIHPKVKERQGDERYPCWTSIPQTEPKEAPDAV